MKKILVFATNNKHKAAEIQQLVGNAYEIKTLADIGCHEDIAETGLTLEENATIKSSYVFNKYGLNCFADDTGLEVEALNGAPGVYSARYAGAQKSDDDNNQRNIGRISLIGRISHIGLISPRCKAVLFRRRKARGSRRGLRPSCRQNPPHHRRSLRVYAPAKDNYWLHSRCILPGL